MLIIYMKRQLLWMSAFVTFLYNSTAARQKGTEKKTRFNVIAIAENVGHHIEYSKAAKTWLNSTSLPQDQKQQLLDSAANK